MKVVTIGSGYVGLITGACFADLGNDVTLIDIDDKKISMINNGETPIHENGLKELMKKINITATTSYNPIADADVVFIAVGTPSNDDGSIDLKYIRSAAEAIGKHIEKYTVITVKSTVIPGTTDEVSEIIEKVSGKKLGQDFGLCMNPEFLREGNAISDFMNPDRVVIGQHDDRSGEVLKELYKSFECPVMFTDIRTAEMIKYVSNVFLAAKVSLSNEVANICELIGSDVRDVMKGVGLDRRISPYFLNAGAGFGGSCFPKDVMAIISLAEKMGYEPGMMKHIVRTNDVQPFRMIKLLKKRMRDLEGRDISVMGLAFKPGTDDIREAPALKVINSLLEHGANVAVYDPEAMENVRQIYGDKIIFAENIEKAIEGKDATLFLTEWKEFKEMDISLFKTMRRPLVVDGRRIFDPELIKKEVEYEAIGYGR